MNIKSKASNKNFLKAAAQVIECVGHFGEALIAHMIGGQLTSDNAEYVEFADVMIPEEKLGVQVKMCNRSHAHRVTFRQIHKLHAEKREKVRFLTDIRHGMYAFVCYNGLHSGKIYGNKSKLLSKKLSRLKRYEIIARELQCVYFVDIDLLHYLTLSDQFADIQRDGTCKVHDARKIERDTQHKILYLTRTFLRTFFEERLSTRLKNALISSLGQRSWCVEEFNSMVEFRGEEEWFSPSIPIRYIGRKRNVLVLKQLMWTGAQIDLTQMDPNSQFQQVFEKAA